MSVLNTGFSTLYQISCKFGKKKHRFCFINLVEVTFISDILFKNFANDIILTKLKISVKSYKKF